MNQNKINYKSEKWKKEVSQIIESVKESNNFKRALTHTSYCNENNKIKSYETLEFLGDSILNFQASLFIYNSFPWYSEGKMSKLKQLMVQENTLASLSKEIGLSKHLRLGTGERKNYGNDKSSILADIFESFIAALYLDKGISHSYRFLELTLFKWIEGKENVVWDYKSRLQEYCQAQKNEIRYSIKGIEKRKRRQIFVIELNDEMNTFREIGKGSSKKEAEQEAAAKVVKKLGIEMISGSEDNPIKCSNLRKKKAAR